ncbi:MAG: hypothetical protein ACKV2V_13690 [Blastocatellia bacterium]
MLYQVFSGAGRFAGSFFSFSFWRYCALILLIFLLPFLSGFTPVLQFKREQVDIQVHPAHIDVRGFYYFRNPYPFPVIQVMSAPLPEDAPLPARNDITIERLEPVKEKLSLFAALGKYRFGMFLAGHEEVCLKVQYKQKTPDQNARYQLTSARQWRQPLTQGVYRLLPQGVTLKSSNVSLQRLSPGIQGFIRHNYLPDDDWDFSWEPARNVGKAQKLEGSGQWPVTSGH